RSRGCRSGGCRRSRRGARGRYSSRPGTESAQHALEHPPPPRGCTSRRRNESNDAPANAGRLEFRSGVCELTRLRSLTGGRSADPPRNLHLTTNRASLPEHSSYVGLAPLRSEEHTSELQSRENLVCRLLLEKK